MSTNHVVTRWLHKDLCAHVGRHNLLLLSEFGGVREQIIDDLRAVARAHYVDPALTEQRLADLGAPLTAQLIRECVPTTPIARSGDLGEILGTEIAELFLDYEIPIRRLQWKDGRNMPLRGDDIIGVLIDETGLAFLKGEAKSRARLSKVVLVEASTALDKHGGRPTDLSVLFVAARLRERGRRDLATRLDEAVANGFAGHRIEHMLFALYGETPTSLLQEHLEAASEKPRRVHAVGLNIADHGHFIADFFRGL